jgi:hypothetical protein
VKLWIAHTPMTLSHKRVKIESNGEYNLMDLEYALPRLIERNFEHLIKHHRTLVWDFHVSSVHRLRGGSFIGPLSAQCYDKVPFQCRLALIEAQVRLMLEAKSITANPTNMPQLSQALAVAYFPKDTLRLINITTDFFTTMQPEPQSQFYSTWQSYLSDSIQTIATHIKSVYGCKCAARTARIVKCNNNNDNNDNDNNCIAPIDQQPFIAVLDSLFDQLFAPFFNSNNIDKFNHRLNQLLATVAPFEPAVERLFNAYQRFLGTPGATPNYEYWAVVSYFLQYTEPYAALNMRIFEHAATAFNGNAHVYISHWDKINADQRLWLLNSFPKDELISTARFNTDELKKLFTDLRYADYHELLSTILASGLSQTTRDQLSTLQDIAIPAVRSAFQRATDSNSPSERSAAYDQLLAITNNSKSPEQLERTLKFLQQVLCHPQPVRMVRRVCARALLISAICWVVLENSQ